MAQVISSDRIHSLLVSFFPQTLRSSSPKKGVAAICHGVMVLSESLDASGHSVIADCKTTALPGTMETSIFWATRAVLGDYYKTFGAGSDTVEDSVKKRLRDPTEQWQTSLAMTPFVVVDDKYHYCSGRFPPDAELLAQRAIEMLT